MIVHIENLSKAIGITLLGLKQKGIPITVWKHKFNIKGLDIETLPTATGFRLEAKYDHQKKWKSDDDIDWSCTISKDGSVREISVSNESSEEALKSWFETFNLRPLVRLITQDGFRYEFGPGLTWPIVQPVPGSDLLIDGHWTGDSEFLLVNVIVYTAVLVMPEIGDFPVIDFPNILGEQLVLNHSLINAYKEKREKKFPDEIPDLELDISKGENPLTRLYTK